MKYREGSIGRVFVIRLEDGDPMPGSIEGFALDQGVSHGLCVLVGGVRAGTVVAGPEDPSARPVHPIFRTLEGVHEIAGMGVIAPGGDGTPRLHMHAALGRGGSVTTGCIRPGIETWQVGEVVLLEILGTGVRRKHDGATGFDLLEP